jgi:hypothetical protein
MHIVQRQANRYEREFVADRGIGLRSRWERAGNQLYGGRLVQLSEVTQRESATTHHAAAAALRPHAGHL